MASRDLTPPIALCTVVWLIAGATATIDPKTAITGAAGALTAGGVVAACSLGTKPTTRRRRA